MRHRRALETQRDAVRSLALLYTRAVETLGTWRKNIHGSSAPCPSLLSSLRSALLPVNVAALLWSRSDRRSQLAAPCQDCGEPNGDNHRSARLFYAEVTTKTPARVYGFRSAASAQPSAEFQQTLLDLRLSFLLRTVYARLAPKESEIDSPPANRRDP